MKRRILTVLVIAIVFASPVFAFQFSPINNEFTPTGAGASKVYTIVNDTDEAIAVAVTATKRCVDKDGNEYTEEIPGYFSITPSKVIVQSGQSQLVRVQYKGPSTVAKELAFRIKAEQVPYSKGRADAGNQMINFLFVYNTSAYVTPTKAVKAHEVKAEYEGNKIKVSIENTGNVHQIMNELSIRLDDDGNTYELTQEEMGNIYGANLLTGAKFLILIDVPESFDGKGKISATATWKQ